MSNTTASSSGLGFGGALTLLFIGLKLTGYITWSWWWVLCPLWIGLAIVLGFFIIGLAILGIASLLHSKTTTRVKTSAFQKKLEEMQKKRDNIKK